MKTVPARPTRQEVRKNVKNIIEKLLVAFPGIDVEYADWEQTNGGDSAYWEERGFPVLRYGVDACLIVRGDPERTEEAAALADAEAARLSEKTNIVIHVLRTNHVWCKKSVPLVAHSVQPGQPIKTTQTFIHEDENGVVFFCFFDDPHEHDWGGLRPQG